ncbi:AAA domain-containing protein [Lentinula lateritia]|uniref:AAA domain-containing protein n=1 Tax=Lentinula aff. lateritia TaxID=2804960 RepID=A0ACC1U4E9_9AGAR|nr:AAA domain-containing protein [Lentinula aff. lateritia]KAJ3853673.1 AAA domain-containing protein [Lentinula lateritia]
MSEPFVHKVGQPQTSGLRAIYIVGPSSTGKTTLCNALATRLGLPPSMHITEVARAVMKEQGFTRADVHSLNMQHAIVKAQVSKDREARQKAAAVGQAVLLSDRSAVDAVVYAALSELKAKSGSTQALISCPDFQEVLPFYRSPRSTFVLLRPIKEWMIDDGVRSLEDGEHCHDMFVRILKELNISYIELGEDCRWLEERIATVRRSASYI